MLYVKQFGRTICVDWNNLYEIKPLSAFNENTFFAVLLTFQESR